MSDIIKTIYKKLKKLLKKAIIIIKTINYYLK